MDVSHLSSNRKVLFFIPARGGSKGIPNKNLSVIGNKTLLARSINYCREAGQLGQFAMEIVVSSDDENIMEEARLSGASVHRRPDEISGDSSTTEQALLRFLSESPQNPSTCLVLVQCTSPFTRAKDLLAGIQAIRSLEYDSAFIGVENHFWLYRFNDRADKWEPDGHELVFRPSRQNIKPRVHETGAAYFFECGKFLENRFRIFGKFLPIVGDHFSEVDIDEPRDLEFAQRLVSIFDGT